MIAKGKGRFLWLVLVLVVAGAGCALGQRKVVVQPKEVAGQNDTDWKITKQP